MNEQQGLMEKREEARQSILALKDKTPTTLILRFFDRWFPKPILEHGLFYWLLQIGLMNAVIILPGLVISLILGEMEKWTGLISAWVFAIELAIYGFVLAHSLFRVVFNDIADRLVFQVSDREDISKLVAICISSRLYFFAFVVLGSVLWSIWTFVNWNIIIGRELGFGLGWMVFLTGCLVGTDFHVLYWMVLLSSRLKTFRYDLNTFTPANSEIISNLTNMLNKIIYFTGSYFAVLTLVVASGLFGSLINETFALPLNVLGWTIIIVQFIVNRSTVNGIIERERWESLNKIQLQINNIYRAEDLSNKDVSERLLRLADLHERIRSNHAGSFDFKSILSLFSQLMLPLLGLLLGNMDKILNLLK